MRRGRAKGNLDPARRRGLHDGKLRPDFFVISLLWVGLAPSWPLSIPAFRCVYLLTAYPAHHPPHTLQAPSMKLVDVLRMARSDFGRRWPGFEEALQCRLTQLAAQQAAAPGHQGQGQAQGEGQGRGQGQGMPQRAQHQPRTQGLESGLLSPRIGTAAGSVGPGRPARPTHLQEAARQVEPGAKAATSAGMHNGNGYLPTGGGFHSQVGGAAEAAAGSSGLNGYAASNGDVPYLHSYGGESSAHGQAAGISSLHGPPCASPGCVSNGPLPNGHAVVVEDSGKQGLAPTVVLGDAVLLGEAAVATAATTAA